MMLLQNGKIREKALMISNKHEVKMIAVKNKRGAENENQTLLKVSQKIFMSQNVLTNPTRCHHIIQACMRPLLDSNLEPLTN